MKRFIDLVRNESLKLWSQTGWRVLAIIFALLLLLTPAFNSLVRFIFGGTLFADSYKDDYAYAEEAREEGRELEAREYETYGEAKKYFAVLGLNETSAEYYVYFNQYQDLLLAQNSLELIASESYSAKELQNEYYSTIYPIYYFLVDYGYYDDIDPQGYYRSNYLSVVEQALEDRSAEEWLTLIAAELAAVRLGVKNFSMESYYIEMREESEKNILLCKERAEEAEQKLTGNLNDNDRAYYEELKAYCADTLSCHESLAEALSILIDRESEYAGWEYNTVFNISYSAANSCLYSAPMTEGEFKEYPYSYAYADAAEYNELVKKDRLLALETQKYVLYSLENSIPIPETLSEGSVKNRILNQFRSIMGTVTILFICYGGIMMAQEYTSGAIRLLLIKPRSRRKILASKLVNLAFWWMASAVASLAVLSIVNVIIDGFGDIFTPDLFMLGDSVRALPAFLAALTAFGEEFVIAMFYVTLAVFFAVLTKKAVLSVLFPILVSIGASVIQSVCLALYEAGAVFLAYTPFFYLDFEPFHSKAYDYFNTSWNIDDMFNTSAFSSVSPDIILGRHASVPLGIILLALVATVIVAIELSVFKKQKI